MKKDHTVLKKAYKNVFRSPEGMVVLRDLISRNRVFNTAYTVGDAHETSFNEGRRRAVLEILNMIVNLKSKQSVDKIIPIIETDNMEQLLHDDTE